MNRHSRYALISSRDVLADKNPALSLPSYMESFSDPDEFTLTGAIQHSGAGGIPAVLSQPNEVVIFLRQLCLLAQKTLDAAHVSIWLAAPGKDELICAQGLGWIGQIGCGLPVKRLEPFGLQDPASCGLVLPDSDLWPLISPNESAGYQMLARIGDPAHWHGLLCCYRPMPVDPDALEIGLPLLRQLSQLATRSLESLPIDGDGQAQLLRQQQLDRVYYALSRLAGRTFLDELVRQLQLVFGARDVWLAEAESLPAKSVRILSSTGVQGLRRYSLQGVSCGELYGQQDIPYLASYEGKLPAPLAPVDFYWALPLLDNRRQVIGHLTLTFEGNEPDPVTLTALQQMLSERVSAEVERLRAEAELRLSAVAFETNEGIVIADPNFVILRVNHAFCHITGYSMQYALGKQLGVTFWPRDGEMIFEFDLEGRWQGEAERSHATGRRYPQWETWSPVYDDHGRISHYVICFEDMSERKAAAQQIQSLVYYDDLTGLSNRRQLMERLDLAFVHARDNDLVGALLFIDLDHFKTINDALGHAVGDWLLLQAAERIAPIMQTPDLLARVGGDEFVMLLSALSSSPTVAEMQATSIAERVIERISQPYQYQGQTLHISASIGISLFPGRNQTPTDLLKQADTAMYQAKSSGRRAVRLFDHEMQRLADRRLLINNQLRVALANNELLLHYQPQHMVGTGELIGAEALVRWQPAGRSLVSPAEFIPIAEETDLIIDIGQWVMYEACSQFVRWYEEGVRLPQISVNVSAKQFHHPKFIDQVVEVLNATGMDPGALNMELTESVVLGNTEETVQKMTELKQLGISFSIDDFGTGYSSLGYLKRLPVDELKIDRSFIQDIPSDISNMAIVEAVVAMASHLNFNVTAEGVETRQQLEFLKKQGCAFFQGYLASKPLPADALERYVRRLMEEKS